MFLFGFVLIQSCFINNGLGLWFLRFWVLKNFRCGPELFENLLNGLFRKPCLISLKNNYFDNIRSRATFKAVAYKRRLGIFNLTSFFHLSLSLYTIFFTSDNWHEKTSSFILNMMLNFSDVISDFKGCIQSLDSLIIYAYYSQN